VTDAAELRVRRATRADMQAILHIESLVGQEAWSARAVGDQLDHPRDASLVAELHGQVVAHVLALLVAGEAEIITLAVHPDHQRRGHARALLAAALRHWSAERVVLEVREHNTAARALYARCGFEPVGRRRRYYADGSDAVVMSASATW